MKIQGKIAVISGGASGMGAATVQHLIEAGAKVAVLDTNKTLLNDIAKHTHLLPIICDVTDENSLVDAFKKIKETWGIPRICVSCAGIVSAKRIVSKDQSPMPLADFAHVVNVNLIGTFNLLRVAASYMATLEKNEDEEENGVVINTASIAAYEGQIGQAAYAASKGGVVSLTLPAARELARYGIRVMAIAPGLIETPMLHSLPENIKETLVANIPFPQRLGKASEFALLVQHIIENSLLNGSVVRLDGALRMSA
jgi:NAD(P)-dependent dehydrogenase (short-subunit alcohol dehydrogenase family)